MKLIHLTELKAGDVFAKEIKLRNRTSFEVIEAPVGKDFIIVKERDILTPNTRMAIDDKKKVYYLRNIFES